jgi:branched-chain amino acid transport system permease protein
MLETFFQQSVYTITLAAVYGLYAAGFVLIFGVLDVLNLSYAFVFMVTANIAVWVTLQGYSIWLGAAAALGVGVLLGYLTDHLAYRPVQRRKRTASGINFAPLISTLAVGAILSAIAQHWFGARNQEFPDGAFPTTTYTIGGVRVTLLQIVVVIAAGALLYGLHLFLRRSVAGRAVRAVAENRGMATLIGVNSNFVISGVWVLSSALAAVAGIFIALVTSSVTTSMGNTFELKGFIVVVLGGMGSVSGAIVAAMLLSVLETVGVLVLGGQYRDLIPLVAIVLILLLRPNGLFGSRARAV